MADLSKFEQYYKMADMLIEKATKEQLAECARLLALNLSRITKQDMANYRWMRRWRWGICPNPNKAHVQLLTDGMETLVGVLGNVCSGLGEEKH
jgi:hypothetical protein